MIDAPIDSRRQGKGRCVRGECRRRGSEARRDCEQERGDCCLPEDGSRKAQDEWISMSGLRRCTAPFVGDDGLSSSTSWLPQCNLAQPMMLNSSLKDAQLKALRDDCPPSRPFLSLISFLSRQSLPLLPIWAFVLASNALWLPHFRHITRGEMHLFSRGIKESRLRQGSSVARRFGGGGGGTVCDFAHRNLPRSKCIDLSTGN